MNSHGLAVRALSTPEPLIGHDDDDFRAVLDRLGEGGGLLRRGLAAGQDERPCCGAGGAAAEGCGLIGLSADGAP
jgi:hypothetical protein